MKFQHLTVFLLAAFALAAWLPDAGATPPLPSPAARVQAAQSLREISAAHLGEIAAAYRRHEMSMRTGETKAPQDNPFDIPSETLYFDADEGAGAIDARIVVDVTALADGVQDLWFMWLPLDNQAVEDEAGNPLTPTLDPYYGTALVTLSAPLNTGDTEKLTFTTSGAPDCSPDPYFGMSFCAVTETLVYFAGMPWVPTKAGNTYEDVFVSGGLSYEITTPPDRTAVSTADPAGVDNLGDHLIHHFTAHFSEYVGGGFAYAPYDVFTAQTHDGKPVTAYISTGVRDFGDHWAQTGADIIDLYDADFSPYLFNKEDMIQASQALGGGYGPQSATFYYADALTTDPAVYYAESIFAHEIGHAWWANMIRPGDQNSPWLSEGFAEFSSRLYDYQVWDPYYVDYLYGSYFHLFQLYVPPEAEVPITSPDIFTDDSNVYFMLTYIKGSHVLRTLQWLLGDDAFFAGMSAYASAYTWIETHQAPGPEEFRATMEQASGLDLAPFFDAFAYSTGYPVYTWSAQFDESADGWTARVRVEQTQPGDRVYDLPVQVEFWLAGQPEQTFFRLDFDGRVADKTYQLDAEPVGARVDGSSWIWGDKINGLVGDVDYSNEVDGRDLIYAGWSQGGDATNATNNLNYLFEADFNRDGLTGQADLDQVLANFGKKGEIHE